MTLNIMYAVFKGRDLVCMWVDENQANEEADAGGDDFTVRAVEVSYDIL